MKFKTRCFLDVKIGDTSAGRIVVELFDDVCPKASDNFKKLCQGVCGNGLKTGKPLHYQGCPFHRIIKGFMIQGGDFSKGDGTGGESIYGGTFADENLTTPHDRPFLLSMANRGPNTNGSQFFITTAPASHLNGKHVVFGHVLSGQEVVAKIEAVPIADTKNYRPIKPVIIENCGELVPVKKKKVHDADKEERKRRKKEKKRRKKAKRREKSYSVSDSSEGPAIRPEEIPEVPQNKFLYRPDARDSKTNTESQRETNESKENYAASRRRAMGDRSGRKVKGRGTMRYVSPDQGSGSRGRSVTPPHWRQASQKMSAEDWRRWREKQENALHERDRSPQRRRRDESPPSFADRSYRRKHSNDYSPRDARNARNSRSEMSPPNASLSFETRNRSPPSSKMDVNMAMAEVISRSLSSPFGNKTKEGESAGKSGARSSEAFDVRADIDRQRRGISPAPSGRRPSVTSDQAGLSPPKNEVSLYSPGDEELFSRRNNRDRTPPSAVTLHRETDPKVDQSRGERKSPSGFSSRRHVLEFDEDYAVSVQTAAAKRPVSEHRDTDQFRRRNSNATDKSDRRQGVRSPHRGDTSPLRGSDASLRMPSPPRHKSSGRLPSRSPTPEHRVPRSPSDASQPARGRREPSPRPSRLSPPSRSSKTATGPLYSPRAADASSDRRPPSAHRRPRRSPTPTTNGRNRRPMTTVASTSPIDNGDNRTRSSRRAGRYGSSRSSSVSSSPHSETERRGGGRAVRRSPPQHLIEKWNECHERVRGRRRRPAPLQRSRSPETRPQERRKRSYSASPSHSSHSSAVSMSSGSRSPSVKRRRDKTSPLPDSNRPLAKKVVPVVGSPEQQTRQTSTTNATKVPTDEGTTADNENPLTAGPEKAQDEVEKSRAPLLPTPQKPSNTVTTAEEAQDLVRSKWDHSPTSQAKEDNHDMQVQEEDEEGSYTETTPTTTAAPAETTIPLEKEKTASGPWTTSRWREDDSSPGSPGEKPNRSATFATKEPVKLTVNTTAVRSEPEETATTASSAAAAAPAASTRSLFTSGAPGAVDDDEEDDENAQPPPRRDSSQPQSVLELLRTEERQKAAEKEAALAAAVEKAAEVEAALEPRDDLPPTSMGAQLKKLSAARPQSAEDAPAVAERKAPPARVRRSSSSGSSSDSSSDSSSGSSGSSSSVSPSPRGRRRGRRRRRRSHSSRSRHRDGSSSMPLAAARRQRSPSGESYRRRRSPDSRHSSLDRRRYPSYSSRGSDRRGVARGWRRGGRSRSRSYSSRSRSRSYSYSDRRDGRRRRRSFTSSRSSRRRYRSSRSSRDRSWSRRRDSSGRHRRRGSRRGGRR